MTYFDPNAYCLSFMHIADISEHVLYPRFYPDIMKHKHVAVHTVCMHMLLEYPYLPKVNA